MTSEHGPATAAGGVTVFGAAYSVYVRIVRLALAEKGVACELREVDIFAAGGPDPAYLARQPFGRIPLFRHGDFWLYEAGAIARYVDDTFDGPPLQLTAPRDRARMNQVIGILDRYAYRTLIWDIVVERVFAPADGRVPDEARIAAAVPRAKTCMTAIEDLMDGGAWLAGPAPTLADLHAAPMFAYFTRAAEATAVLARRGRLATWWQAMAERPAMAATRFPLETEAM